MRRFFTVPFAVEPEGALSPDERRLLEEVPDLAARPRETPFLLRITDDETGARFVLHDSGAEIGWAEDRITIRHEDFIANIWPQQYTGTLVRRGTGTFALQLTLETAASAVLPLSGSVVLHAAAIVVEGRACVFFGPSGIGKSTLARLAPYPSMADELVVLSTEGGIAAWAGELPEDSAALPRISEPLPVAALFQLDRSEDVEIHRLDGRAAIRKLLGATLVYPIKGLWQGALGVLERAISGVPVYRLGWAMQDSAWESIRVAASVGNQR